MKKTTTRKANRKSLEPRACTAVMNLRHSTKPIPKFSLTLGNPSSASSARAQLAKVLFILYPGVDFKPVVAILLLKPGG